MGCCAGHSKNGDGDLDVDETDTIQHNRRKKNRGCTDVVFLVIFIMFWIGVIYIAAYSFIYGDVFRLVYGYDSYGNTCNRKNAKIPNNSRSGMDMTGKKRVFFMDVTKLPDTLALCVERCPDRELATMNDVHNFANNDSHGAALCDYYIERGMYKNVNVAEFTGPYGPCPVLPVAKSLVLLRRCIPVHATLRAFGNFIENNIISQLNLDDLFSKALSDLYSSWLEMLILLALALVLAFLAVLVMRYVAKVMVWLILTVVIVASVLTTVLLWWTYASYRRKLNDDTKHAIPLLDVEIKAETAFLVYSIISSIVTVVLLLVILVMRKRLALTVALFAEAGSFVAQVPAALFEPLLTALALLLFIVFWTVVLGYLSTSGTPEVDPVTERVQYQKWKNVRYMWWYMIIALIWTSEFMVGCQQMVIAGAVASWYFTRDKTTVKRPLAGAICRVISHHLGTVIFGSFIITLVRLPRWILLYMEKKLDGKTNACAKCCLRCCVGCLWCMDKCMRYLNKNAYTVTAIEGSSFCTAARKAFTTLVNNALRVAAINSVGDFVLLLGKLSVMSTCTALAVLWLKQKDDLHFYPIPVLLVAISSYMVANVFFSVYEMIVDAMLLCFCEDCRLNDGVTPGKFYYMSPSLMKFVEDSSRALDALSKRKQKEDAPDGTRDERRALSAERDEPDVEDSRL